MEDLVINKNPKLKSLIVIEERDDYYRYDCLKGFNPFSQNSSEQMKEWQLLIQNSTG